jgi:hypothetical protein
MRKPIFRLCSLTSERRIKEPAQNKGRPRLHLREAIFSAGFKVYSAVSTRRFMSDLVQASAYGYISSVPHYNSILTTFKSSHVTPLLHDLIRESSFCLKSVEVDFAVDSSGLTHLTPSVLVQCTLWARTREPRLDESSSDVRGENQHRDQRRNYGELRQ